MQTFLPILAILPFAIVLLIALAGFIILVSDSVEKNFINKTWAQIKSGAMSYVKNNWENWCGNIFIFWLFWGFMYLVFRFVE